VTQRRRVLVCGWSGAGNVGDELLTSALLAMAENAGIELVVRSADPARTRQAHPGVQVVGRGLWPVLTLGGCDAVCVGPGGIIQDSSSVWSLPMHLAPALVARLRRRPVVGLGLGADRLLRRSSRWLLRWALAGQPVVVRDEASREALAVAGVEADIDSDLAVEELIDRAPGEGCGVVVAIGPNAGRGRFRRGRDRLVHDDPQVVAGLVDDLVVRFGGPVQAVLFRGERDRWFATQVVDRTKHPVTIVEDPHQAVEAVWNAAVVITSRFHAALVGVMAGAVVVADVRQQKVASLSSVPELASRFVTRPGWVGNLPDQLPARSVMVTPQRTGANRRILALLSR